MTRGLLEAPHTTREAWAWRLDLLVQVAVFMVSIPIAFIVGSQWAWTTWALLIVVAPLSGRRVERVRVEARGAHGVAGPNPAPVAVIDRDQEG